MEPTLVLPPMPTPKEAFTPPNEVLVDRPLYWEFSTATVEGSWYIIELLFFDEPYDAFCTDCERDATFHICKSASKVRPVRDSDAEQEYEFSHGYVPYPQFADGIYTIEARCTRDESHQQHFVFHVKREFIGHDEDAYIKAKIQKVGQLPAYGQLHMSHIKKYAKVLSKSKLGELNRAIHLASHDVGVGAYVYLRRIFESLLEEAHALAKKQSDWDESVFPSRVGERIQFLKDLLPRFLVEHPDMYGLLSKGIHELSEEDCLAHFETLRIAIELILDERLEHEEKTKKIAAARAALNQAILEIKK